MSDIKAKTKELITILQAYMEGKEIEYKDKDGDYWFTALLPTWNTENFHYRIKQNWYDNITEEGVYCKVWDLNPDNYLYLPVKEYTKQSDYPFDTGVSVFKNATPLTEKGVQGLFEKFLKNVPK